MERETIVRLAALYAPMAVAGALWWYRGSRRVAAAALVACAWNSVTVLAVNRVAVPAGWWTFGVRDGVVAGMPVDLGIGWTLLWGAVPVLMWPSMRVPIVALALFWFDLLLMPQCAPVLSLGPAWIAGEIVAIGVALVPSLYLATWTVSGRHATRRAALQASAFSALILFVLPEIVFAHTGGTWAPVLARPGWLTNLWIQLLALPAVVGLSAVQEFAVRGNGTPVPYDPPQRLVRSGPYAYIANPMQCAMCLVLVGWGALLDNWWIVAGSISALAYSAGLASWHEDAELTHRFGEAWSDYRQQVHRWRPRWRPALIGPPARLYVAASCGVCRDVGGWIARRGAIGLEIVAAESFPGRALERMTYVPADGSADEAGIAAFGRALEHINFGWAWLGMLMRLPPVRPVLQLLVDASGGEPRACATSQTS